MSRCRPLFRHRNIKSKCQEKCELPLKALHDLNSDKWSGLGPSVLAKKIILKSHDLSFFYYLKSCK